MALKYSVGQVGLYCSNSIGLTWSAMYGVLHSTIRPISIGNNRQVQSCVEHRCWSLNAAMRNGR